SISSCRTRLQFLGYIATNRNSERCLHFGRHDRATQHGNISHVVANEVEAFAGERAGSLAVPGEAQLLQVSGQALSAKSGRMPNFRRFGYFGDACTAAWHSGFL